MTARLMAHAFCSALAAFIFGLSVGHIVIKHLDSLLLAAGLLSDAALVRVLFRTRSAVQRLGVSRTRGRARGSSCGRVSSLPRFPRLLASKWRASAGSLPTSFENSA